MKPHPYECASCGAEAKLLFEVGLEYERVKLQVGQPKIVGEAREPCEVTRVQVGLKGVCRACAINLVNKLARAGDNYHMAVVWSAKDDQEE